MSAAEDRAAKASRLLRARSAASVPSGASARSAPSVRVRPVRLTVDVPPSMHEGLRRLRLQLGLEVGAEVSGQDVLRALLGAALSDPTARGMLLAQLLRQSRTDGTDGQ